MNLAPLQLDFAPRTARPVQHGSWVVLAAVVLVGLLLVGHESASHDAEVELQDRNALLLQRLQPAHARRGGPSAEEAQRIARANTVIDELALPWARLFRAVEAADARGLGVLSLVPNAQDGSLRLTGESRSLADLLAYVERVAAQPALSEVHLLGYDTVARDGVQIVSFTLAARWQRTWPSP